MELLPPVGIRDGPPGSWSLPQSYLSSQADSRKDGAAGSLVPGGHTGQLVQAEFFIPFLRRAGPIPASPPHKIREVQHAAKAKRKTTGAAAPPWP